MRPFTRKQFLAWLEGQRGWGDDMVYDALGEQVDLESAAFDLAQGAIRFPTDDDTKRAVAYLRSTGVSDLVGCLADYMHDVRHDPTQVATEADVRRGVRKYSTGTHDIND